MAKKHSKLNQRVGVPCVPWNRSKHALGPDDCFLPKIPTRVVPLSDDNKTEWASLAALNFMLPANFAFLV
jgi:hypothetical protein